MAQDKPKLYMIRGTGLSLDGLLVEITFTGVEEFVFFRPYKKDTIAQKSCMIHKKYIQELTDEVDFSTYRFTVEKSNPEYPQDAEEHYKKLQFTIEDCPRNVSLESIQEFIAQNLKPILKME